MQSLVNFGRLVSLRGTFPVMASPMTFPRLYSAPAAGLTLPEVKERVVKIVSQFDKVDPAKVNEKSHFINDLGLDSLDAVELVMAFEDEFAFEVPESDLENIVSVEQAIAYVLANPHAK